MPLAAAVLYWAILGPALPIEKPANVDLLPFVFAGDERVAVHTDRSLETPAGQTEILFRVPDSAGQIRLDVFEDRSPASPRWTRSSAAESRDGSLSVSGRPGARVLVVARLEGQPDYLLEGPFVWPAQPLERRIPGEMRFRTLTGQDALALEASRFRLFAAEGQSDALCETLEKGRWQCVGVPTTGDGILQLCSPDGSTGFADVSPGHSSKVSINHVAWSAVAELAGPDGKITETPSVEVAILKRSPGGAGFLVPEKTLQVRQGPPGLLFLAGSEPVADQIVQFRLPSRYAARIALTELMNGGCGEPLAVSVEKAGSVFGTVSGEDHQPLGGALVALLEADPEHVERKTDRPVSRVLADSQTDVDGRFEFPDAPRGRYRLRGCHAAVGCADRTAVAGSEPSDLVLVPRAVFRGRVVAGSGIPEATAMVRITATLEHYTTAPDRLTALPMEIAAGPDGRFQIAAPSDGHYVIEARSSKAGIARRSVELTPFSPPTTDLGDLRIGTPGEFVARLTECAGGALALSGPMGSETGLPAQLRFPIAADGRADVELPEGGSWLVAAECAGVRRYVDPIFLRNVEELFGQEIVLRLAPTSKP
jgi:hypothetical protein